MILKTTNKQDFSDFKIVTKKSRRSQSSENIPDKKTLVVFDKKKIRPNDSKGFQSTLTFNSPFFHKSSYNFNFQNYGECKTKLNFKL